MVRWVFINAIGGVTISSLTLVAASYLLYSLWRQGSGKLRVRLLLGMVISDLFLGLVAIVPESIYLANGVGLKTGSGGCDAQAFLITTILFTQHLWTLVIALATFLLLKHPLSRATTVMERWSWTCAPLIWAISLIHSGIWWATVGFTSGGNFCYYGSSRIPSANDLDARDLVQFIPRAIVFIVIIALYSRLFSFLRRPDTIQLSSHFASGGVASDPHRGVAMGRILRRLGGGSTSMTPPHKNEPVNPDAPWEQLEFIQVGNSRPWGSPVQSVSPQYPTTSMSGIEGGILLPSRPVSPKMAATPLDDEYGPPPSLPRLSISSSTGSPSGPSSQRPSETDTLVTPELRYDMSGRPQLERLSSSQKITVLSPVASGGTILSTKLDLPPDNGPFEDHPIAPNGERRASGQTLKEFFQENQAPGLDEEARGSGSGSNNAKTGMPISATAYFNRQASLLMLYFPLAYMVVFSVSLVRLIYGMVHKQPSPVLTLMSSWMVLSVGLIDGLVYGLAEFLVRRRVRRKMPDRM